MKTKPGKKAQLDHWVPMPKVGGLGLSVSADGTRCHFIHKRRMPDGVIVLIKGTGTVCLAEE